MNDRLMAGRARPRASRGPGRRSGVPVQLVTGSVDAHPRADLTRSHCGRRANAAALTGGFGPVFGAGTFATGAVTKPVRLFDETVGGR